MSKILQAKDKKLKLSKLVSTLIDPFRNLKLNIQQSAPHGKKSKSKIPGIEHGKSNLKKDAFVCDSSAKENNSSLTDTESSQLYKDPILQKYDEVKTSCLHNNKEIEPNVAAPTKSENEVKFDNLDTDKSLNKQSECEIVALFGDRSIKSEPVDDNDDESKILCALQQNKCKDDDEFPDEYSNHHENITCLENKSINKKETDNVNFISDIESDDENLLERGVEKTPKRRERHSEYPSRASTTVNVADIEKLNDIDVQKLIAVLENEYHLAKMIADEEIMKPFCMQLRPNNSVSSDSNSGNSDSNSNPAIISQHLKTDARYTIFYSLNFSVEKYSEECSKMIRVMQDPKFISEEHQVIHRLNKKYNKTNLHEAVESENLEKTLCIVEMHKYFYFNSLSEWINARGCCHPEKNKKNTKKTALDMAKEKRNVLLFNYLKENLAEPSVHTTPINTPGT